jgi:recombination protein RecA
MKITTKKDVKKTTVQGKSKEQASLASDLSKKYDGILKEVDSKENFNILRLESEIPSIDLMLGGGVPLGRLIEVFGPEGSGKSTLCLHFAKIAHEKGMKVAYIDMERTYTADYSKRLGIPSLTVARPNYGEQAFDIIIDLLKDDYKLIIVDSVAAMIPKAEVEEKDESNALGLHARMMSRYIRKIVPIASQNNAAVIFINQLRSKVSHIPGAQETTTGGMALRFFTSIRMELRKISASRPDSLLRHEIRVKMIKNKTVSVKLPGELIVHMTNGRGI